MAFDARPHPPPAPFDRTLRHTTLRDTEIHASEIALKSCERLLLAAQSHAEHERRRANAACASVRTLQLAVSELEEAVDDAEARCATEVRSRETQRVEYESLVDSLRASARALEDALREGRAAHDKALRNERAAWRTEREVAAGELRAERFRLERSLQLQSSHHQAAIRKHDQRGRAAVEAVRKAYEELKAQSGAAVFIAAGGRGHTARRAFVSRKRAAMLVQACARRRLARKQLQRLREQRRRASVTLQAAARRSSASADFVARRQAAVAVQSGARRLFAQQHMTEARGAARRVQSAARGQRARAAYRGTRAAAVRVQTAGRGLNARREQAARQRAAVRLQSAWAGHSDRRMISDHLAEMARMEQEAMRQDMLRELMMYA